MLKLHLAPLLENNLTNSCRSVSISSGSIDRRARIWASSWYAREWRGFTRFSVDYVDQQEEARVANLGVHAHDCVPAWEWRAQHRQAPSGSRPFPTPAAP